MLKSKVRGISKNACLPILVIALLLVFLTISQNPVYAFYPFDDDFNDGNDDGWTRNSGTWAVENGEYSQNSTDSSGLFATISNRTFSDFDMEFRYNIKDYAGDTGNWAGVILRKTNAGDNYTNSGYLVYVRYSGSITLYKPSGSLISYNTGETQTGTRSLRISINGSSIKIFYNGCATPVIDYNDTSFSSGYVSLVTGKTHTHYDDIAIYSPSEPIEFNDDFADGNDDGWTVNSGTWAVESGEYSQSVTSTSGLCSTISNHTFNDFDMEYKYSIMDYAGNTGNWAGVILRKTNAGDNYTDSGYLVYVRYNGTISLYKLTGNLVSYNTGETQTGTRSLKISVKGSNIKIYYNGDTTPVIDYSDTSFSGGYISLVTGKTHTHYDDVAISGSTKTVNLVLANLNLNINGSTEYRVVTKDENGSEDTGSSAYTLEYDSSKLSIDTAKKTIKALAAGRHTVTITQGPFQGSAAVAVNDFDTAVRIKGQEILYQNFEGTVPSCYLPDSCFTVVDDGGNKVLYIDSYSGVKKTDFIDGSYGDTDYMVEADIKQINCGASSNGGISMHLRGESDYKNYVIRYIDVAKYNSATHRIDTSSTALRDRIGIARDENSQLNNWYYGAFKTDAALGILNTTDRNFNGQYYKMTGLVMGSSTVKKSDGNVLYHNLVNRITALDGTLKGEVYASFEDTDYNNSSMKMNPLLSGKLQLGAENTKVYFDNLLISKVHVARGLQLLISNDYISSGQTTGFELRAIIGTEYGDFSVIAADKATYSYDSSKVSVNTANGTITALAEGEHVITATVSDVFTGEQKSYSARLTVRNSDISENFESGKAANPDYFSIAPSSIISDGTNKVYKLRNEISRLFGNEDWTNYTVEGRLKIIDRRIDTGDYNTSFEVVMRRQSLQGELNSKASRPFVYRIGSSSSDNYMRIGCSPGPKLNIEDSGWHTFSAKVSREQMVFTIDSITQYYCVDDFDNGGFCFRANNCEVYLDDITVIKDEGEPYGSTTLTSVSTDKQNITAVKYDMCNMAEMTTVKANYSNGKSKYITCDSGLSWTILSGSDKADLMNADTVRFRSNAANGDVVTVRASYGDCNCDINLTVSVPAGSEIDYIRNGGTDIRQENLLYKLRRNYETGTVLTTKGLPYLAYIFGKLVLNPEERNYDAEINWMIDQCNYEESMGRALSAADFVTAEMMLTYKELDGKLSVSSQVWDDMKNYLKTFHYATPDEFLSENHKIIHYVIGYLTCESWPSDTMWNGLTGSSNKATFKTYIKDWMNRRLKVGMGEYDSSYYGIDISAFSLLYDYAQDTSVKNMASDMLKYLFADMLCDSIESKLGGAKNRTYVQTIEINNGMYNYLNDMYFDTSILDVYERYNIIGVQAALPSICSFRPSDVLMKIARDQTKRFTNKERKQIYQIPDDPLITESLKKYTHVTPEYVLGSVVQQDAVSGTTLVGDYRYKDTGTWSSPGTWIAQSHQDIPWSLTFSQSMKALIFDSHPGPGGETQVKAKHSYFNGDYNCLDYKYFQEDNVLLGMHKITNPNELQFTHFWLPKNELELVEEEEGWIFINQGNVYAAIKPVKDGTVTTTPQYTWTLSGKYADIEAKVNSANTAFICEVADNTEYTNGYSAFKTAIKNNTITYVTSGDYYLEYTGLNGKTLRLEYDTDVRKVNGSPVNFSNYKLHDSPYVNADWNTGTITISYGGDSETITLVP